MPDEKPPETPTDEPKSPPRLKIVKPKRGQVTAEMYEQLARAYLESQTRTMRGLARDTGLSQDTCAKAINLGWPERGWPPLRERAELYDKQKRAAADQPALTPNQLVDVRKFIEMRNENLGMLRSFRALAARLSNRINEVLPSASANRYGKRTRVIDVQHGKRVVQKVVTEDVVIEPYLPHLASALRDLGQLAFGAGEQEKRWLKIEPPEGDAPMTSGWEDMTDEQLDFVARTGKLPPGFTREGLRTKK